MSGLVVSGLVLGIDTATRAGSVALVRAGAEGHVEALAEVGHDPHLRHAETLVPAVDECLDHAGCTLSEVKGIAVSIGPGSFTGLRVGLATAKGLALAGGAWLVGVPTLEAHARAAGSGLVAVLLDARKGEVYSALFEVHGDEVERLLADAVEGPRQAAERIGDALGGRSKSVVLRLTGDGAGRYRDEVATALEPRVAVDWAPHGPEGRGLAVATLGVRRVAAGGPADLANLAPAYLRVSEAERLRAARSRPDAH